MTETEVMATSTVTITTTKTTPLPTTKPTTPTTTYEKIKAKKTTPKTTTEKPKRQSSKAKVAAQQLRKLQEAISRLRRLCQQLWWSLRWPLPSLLLVVYKKRRGKWSQEQNAFSNNNKICETMIPPGRQHQGQRSRSNFGTGGLFTRNTHVKYESLNICYRLKVMIKVTISKM